MISNEAVGSLVALGVLNEAETMMIVFAAALVVVDHSLLGSVAYTDVLVSNVSLRAGRNVAL